VYGRARLYRIGLVVFVAGSISGGLAVEPRLLIASRVVQGIGAAMLAPAGLSLLVISYPGDKERSRALGTYGAIVSAGFASGAVLGGLLVEVTWRLVFFVNVPIGIALLIAARAAAASRSARKRARFGHPRGDHRDRRGRLAGAGHRAAIALVIALAALAGAALSVLADSLPGLLVAVTGSYAHRTTTAMFITAGFALLGLLATRVVPPKAPAAPHPHPSQPQAEPEPHHLFHHFAGGIP
jgi:MFS family permease